jgi:hypothetical protein
MVQQSNFWIITRPAVDWFAALLQLLKVRHNSWHIPGAENIIADLILNLTHFSLSHFN